MKKEDLKCGNVVELRNGNLGVVTTFYTTIVDLQSGACLSGLYDYTDDLFVPEDHELDVMKVYKDYTLNEILWKRKENPILTPDEKVVLRNLDKKYNYIVRNKSGYLTVHVGEPTKYSGIDCCWTDTQYTHINPFNHLFQFIKWEDDEPYLISELLED